MAGTCPFSCSAKWKYQLGVLVISSTFWTIAQHTLYAFVNVTL